MIERCRKASYPSRAQPMEKILFIINPKSGTDRAKAIEHLVLEHMDPTRFQVTIAHTQYAKHGTELARKALKDGYETIVAVGGDGSVNDVIVALAGSKAKLGIIPKGSGNGLARSLHIPLDTVQAIRSINEQHHCPIDLGKAGDVLFASNVGVGFDVLVARKFAKSQRRGMVAYSWIVTKHLWKYKEWKWDLQIDGRPLKSKAFILTVANAQQFGYNFKIAPIAELQDGLFDVVVIRKYPKILGAMIALRAFKGTLLKSKYVAHYRAKRVTIGNPDLELFQADGDTHACKATLEIEMLEKAINVIVPANRK